MNDNPNDNCDLCSEEPAVMSQMNLSTWETVRVGANCMVPFLLSMIQSLTGMEPDLTTAGGGTAETAADGHQDAPEGPPATSPADSTAGAPKPSRPPRTPRGKAAKP